MNRAIKQCLAAAAVLAAVLVVGATPASAADVEYVVLYNGLSGQAMAVKGASTANGALAIQYPYEGGANNDVMVLEWADGGSNWVRIKPRHTYTPDDGNVHNDKCLVVEGASKSLGASIIQHTCTYDSTDNDVWYAETWSSNLVQYRNRNSNLCIVVKGASHTPGAELIQYTCNTTLNSFWFPEYR